MGKGQHLRFLPLSLHALDAGTEDIQKALISAGTDFRISEKLFLFSAVEIRLSASYSSGR